MDAEEAYDAMIRRERAREGQTGVRVTSDELGRVERAVAVTGSDNASSRSPIRTTSGSQIITAAAAAASQVWY